MASQMEEEAEGESSTDYLPNFSSPEMYFQALLKRMVECTQKSNGISSSSDDYEFWSSYPYYNQTCMELSGRIQRRISQVLHHHGVPCPWTDAKGSALCTSDVEGKFEDLIEANDTLLERVDLMIDEAAKEKKGGRQLVTQQTPSKPIMVSAWNKKAEKSRNFKLLLATNIQRPQLKWLDTVDNSNTSFIPKLEIKPNSLKPWLPGADNTVNDNNCKQDQGIVGVETLLSRHPYAYELSVFQPQDWQLEEREPKQFLPLKDVACTYIDNIEDLKKLSDLLKKEKEFAIDLEAHSYRSFLGFVCLMQISTRDQDFLVDTIELRRELNVLNESFTDPSILKVMHGADMDIGWLQRDFGLYIVNLFDTGQAARLLGLGRFSLAFLLHKYCNVSADKQYQLADWRMRPIIHFLEKGFAWYKTTRPLPEEMAKYAREDTHYLLYIKDRMRNDLLKAGARGSHPLLSQCYSKSTAVASKIYEKPIFSPESYEHAYNKYRRPLNQHQLECFKLLYAWRDKVARDEDESTGYVLPNHMILSISENLPREPQGVLACCNPVPPLVKQRLQEVHALVEEAKHFDFELVSTHDLSITTDTEPGKRTEASGNAVPRGQRRYNKLRGILSGMPARKNGLDMFSVKGPSVDHLNPSFSLFETPEKMKEPKSPGEQKAALILASFRSPFELFFVKTAKSSKDPSEITKRWRTMSSTQKPEQAASILPSPSTSREKKAEKPEALKRQVNKEDESEQGEGLYVSLRDMLPAKKKKKKKKDIIRDSSSEQGSGTESPVVALSYEKTGKEQSFVPFDYSKSDMKAFSGRKLSGRDDVVSTMNEKSDKAGAARPRSQFKPN